MRSSAATPAICWLISSSASRRRSTAHTRTAIIVVTIESIVPNLGLLREYKPLMTEFWREGLFSGLDERYFRLVDRSTDMADEVDWALLDKSRVFESFRAIFNNQSNVQKEAYFDKMTHFDFKCLLPALLQVEDRMSMAHGLESRVPLLDHPLIEFLATVPADVKFAGGRMKHLLKLAYADVAADSDRRSARQDGFPGAAEGMVFRRVARLRPGYFPQPPRPAAAISECRRRARQFRERRRLLPQSMGPAVPRTVASDLSRPRRRLPAHAGRGKAS